MERRQRTQRLVIMLIAIFLLSFSACTQLSESPADLLSRKDYDWGYWPSVTFIYMDREYHTLDVHRDEGLLGQAFDLQDQLVIAYWDETNAICELDATEGTGSFYLLSSDVDSNIILIIPTSIRKRWFEDNRPLAFCLKADETQGTVSAKITHPWKLYNAATKQALFPGRYLN